MHKYNLHINSAKTVCGTTSICILSYEIINGTMRPDQSRIKPLLSMLTPATIRGRNCILGMLTYHTQCSCDIKMPSLSNSRLSDCYLIVCEPDLKSTHKRALRVYKAFIKQIPCIIANYELPLDEKLMRDTIRKRFTDNAHISDYRVIDIMLMKTEMELVELINVWKMRSHTADMFDADTLRHRQLLSENSKSFIRRFLSGSD
ncbi:hypothetical protein GJ496_011647 [Pomphorhynchus laevis]|nr:hypothetical protein GJ496_011647 [Pomphorhynchus laevis]